MKTIRHLKLFVLFFSVVACADSAFAQNDPIGCNAQFYISNGAISGASNPTALNKLSFSGGLITATSQPLNPGNMGFNAMGINPLDGYIYAVRYPANNAAARLVRIGSGGTNQLDLGAISNMNNNEIAYSGCFDENGDFYFTTTGGRFMKIVNPITSRNASQVSGSGFSAFADIAINPVDGQMYGTTNSTGSNYLFTINKTTGAISSGVGPNMGGAGFIAGLFFDEVGQLYGYRSAGSLFLINKTTGVLTAVGSAASYSGADGCSCSTGRVFHELSAPGEICPGQGGNNFPEFDLTVLVTNKTSSQQTGLKYELTIGHPSASNRFSFIETPTVIAQRLFNIGFLPTNNPAQVLISSAAPGTNNKIEVTSFQTGGVNVTDSFTLKVKFVTPGTPYESVAMQSIISQLPAAIGGQDLSNDPNTPAPDDPTVIAFCSGGPLPVNLLSFAGSYKNNATLLNWIVDSEINSAFYEIERSSNGIEFISIGIETINGNSTGRAQYKFTDDLVFEPGKLFYYRLRIVDHDGKFKYSNIVLIRKDQKLITGIRVSPNPVLATDLITVRFEADGNAQIELSIVDFSGRTVAQQQSFAAEGTNSIHLQNVKKLQPGLYFIRLANGTNVQTTRMVIAQ